MTDETLVQLLNELRTTIERSETMPDEERERLENLADRIENRVDSEQEGIIDHIGDSVGLFETDHPDLVRTLNRIAQTLNAAGI